MNIILIELSNAVNTLVGAHPLLYFVSYVICILILVAMSVEDFFFTDVAGEACLALWVMMFFSLILFQSSVGVITFTVICCVIFYCPLEIRLFGDADILPIVMFTIYYARGLDQNTWIVTLSLFPMVVLLVVLYPYALFYAHYHHKKYRLMSRTMVPVLPAFAIALTVSGLVLAVLYCI